MAKRTSNNNANVLADAHHFYLATAGGAPASDSSIIAGVAGKSIYITGYSICCFGSESGTQGSYAFTDGNVSGTANTVIHGMATGTLAAYQSISLDRPVKLTAGNDLKLTSTEATGNVFLTGMIYYKLA